MFISPFGFARINFNLRSFSLCFLFLVFLYHGYLAALHRLKGRLMPFCCHSGTASGIDFDGNFREESFYHEDTYVRTESDDLNALDGMFAVDIIKIFSKFSGCERILPINWKTLFLLHLIQLPDQMPTFAALDAVPHRKEFSFLCLQIVFLVRIEGEDDVSFEVLDFADHALCYLSGFLRTQ